MKDSDVRFAVLSKLQADHNGDPDTRIVEEMGVWSGSVRVDIAVINGELCGYELKSDKDTLERLPFQAELYSKVFDRIELVVGERHLEKAEKLIPGWWGITLAKSPPPVSLLSHKSANVNPCPDPYLVAQLLWKSEALEVLGKFCLDKGWKSKRVKLIHQRLAAEIPFTDLAANVREMLKRRKNWLREYMAS